MRQGGCPDIQLHEDDVEAMEIILSLLHYKYALIRPPLSIATLASVAIQCAKYQCAATLLPLMMSSFTSIIQRNFDAGSLCLTVQQVASLVGAAHIFQAHSCWVDVSSVALNQLPPNFRSEWFTLKISRFIPREIPGKTKTS